MTPFGNQREFDDACRSVEQRICDSQLRLPKSPGSTLAKLLSPSQSELLRYRAILSQASVSRSPDPIPNLYPWHAVAAIGELADLALGVLRDHKDQETDISIRLLTGSCSNFFYGGDVAKKLLTFASLGGKIKVLVWNTRFAWKECQLLNMSLDLDLYGKSVEFKFSAKESILGLSHFMVIDELAYRWEPEHHDSRGTEEGAFSAFDPEVPARICFSDEANAKRLVRIFEMAWGFFPIFDPYAAADLGVEKV